MYSRAPACRLDRLRDVLLVVEGGERGPAREFVRREGSVDPSVRLAPRLRDDAVPDPEPGEAVRLREGAQHRHVVALVDQRDRAVDLGELPVRLVDDDERLLGGRVRDRPHLVEGA